jgi:RNA polymerase sigma-70 factor, ECF subfamily
MSVPCFYQVQQTKNEGSVQDRTQPQPEYSDEALGERVARRDVVAFTLLYDRYAQSVYALAAHLLDEASAEEAVQEIFLRLWNKADQFDADRGSFRGWFMTIARNHVMDELGRRNREQRIRAAEEVEELLAGAVDPDSDVAEEAWLHERRETMLQALKSLPSEQRRAIVLAYFGGLSQSSIAQELGWPLGTVKKRIRLGLQKLRAFFVHEDEVL